MSAWLGLLVSQGCLLLVEEALAPPQPITQINLSGLYDQDIYGDPLLPLDPPPNTTILSVWPAAAIPLGGTIASLHGVVPTPNLAAIRRHINGSHPLYLCTPVAAYIAGDLGGADSVTGGTVEIRSRQFVPVARALPVRRVARKCGPFKEAGEIETPAPPPSSAVSPRPIPNAGFPAVQWNPPPSVNTYTTLQDVVVEVFKGYTPEITDADPLIGIAEVTNANRPTYAVFLGGIDRRIAVPDWEQFTNAILNAAGTKDLFTDYIRDLIQQNTVEDSIIWAFGHSQGAMSAQSFEGTLINGLHRRTCRLIVGVGTLWIVADPFSNVPKNLFRVELDPLPYLGPFGNATGPRILALMATAGQSEVLIAIANAALPIAHTRLDHGDTPANPVARHNCYPFLDACKRYWWDGTAKTDAPKEPMITGTVYRFEWPPF